MKLTPITEHTAMIDGTTTVTVYLLPDGGCVLIDPGYPTDFEKLDSLLQSEGLLVRGVLATHAHYDHFGSARMFCEKYRLPVILPAGELAPCRSAHALAAYLGFVSSFRITKSATLSSVLGPVDEVIGFAQDSITVAGAKFDIIHTPGHTTDNVSFRTPDGVLAIGDVLFSRDVLPTMRAPYTTALGLDIAAKRLIAETPCTACVTAHHGFLDGKDVPALARDNIAMLQEMIDAVRSIIDHPMHIDEIIPIYCEMRRIHGATPMHGLQMRHTLSAVIGYLIDEQVLASHTELGLTRYFPAADDTERELVPFNGSELQGYRKMNLSGDA